MENKIELEEELVGIAEESMTNAENVISEESNFIEHMNGMETEILRGEEINGEHVEEVIGIEEDGTMSELDSKKNNANKFCEQMLCNKLASRQQTKKELSKHTDFRSLTSQTSSGVDTVDRVNMMYLTGNTDLSRNHQGQRIQDVFNNLTKGTDLYKRQCVRMPEFDKKQDKEKYDFNGEKELSLNQSEWEYNNERIINGGNITDTLIGFDPNGGNLHQL